MRLFNRAMWMMMCAIAVAAVGALLSFDSASAQDKVKVVATFSILADLVKNVGGERLVVHSLVGPSGDAHVYNPTPGDAKFLADAKVVILNGLGYEGWLERLVRASGTKARQVVASNGIKALRAAADRGHNHGHFDPHAWQSVGNVKIYIGNIRDGLIAADPAGKAAYEANAAAYLAKLDVLENEVREAVARIPVERRRIVTTHNAFGYFADAYGVEMFAPQGVSTETQPSAKDVANLIRLIKARKIGGVFMENISDPRLIERIGKETGAKIGGVLYSDALTEPAGPAPTYIDLIRHNIRTLSAALSS